jgi:hypothetical protein
MHDIYTRYTLGETVSIHFDYYLSIQFSYIRGVVGWVSVVYYESIKRELKRRLIYEYRCNERLKTKNEESTRLTDTGLVVEVSED